MEAHCLASDCLVNRGAFMVHRFDYDGFETTRLVRPEQQCLIGDDCPRLEGARHDETHTCNLVYPVDQKLHRVAWFLEETTQLDAAVQHGQKFFKLWYTLTSHI